MSASINKVKFKKLQKKIIKVVKHIFKFQNSTAQVIKQQEYPYV